MLSRHGFPDDLQSPFLQVLSSDNDGNEHFKSGL